MNFFIIMGTLCIFLNVCAGAISETCPNISKKGGEEDLAWPYGFVCTEIVCDWGVHYTCKNGTYSKLLKWETDIFEIGFRNFSNLRPREIVVKIDLNDDYYIEIKVISYYEKGTVKVILNECSHTRMQCLENRNFIHNVPYKDRWDQDTYVAIGFRKDKKINFASETNAVARATNLFGLDNEYEFKMSGFYFNTDETMKITVYSEFDRNYEYDGFAMQLSTSVGGMFFDKDGYLLHDNFLCFYYWNPDEGKGLPYIIREYFDNSENWRAPPVEWTLALEVPYFNKYGMKVDRDKMLVKEEQNPNFDAKKMIRKGCSYVDKPNEDTETDITETTTTTESTSREEETKETTSREEETKETTSREEETTETTKIPDDLTEKSVPSPMLPDRENRESLPEGEIRINQTIFIRKLPSEKNIDLKDFIDSVGRESLDEAYVKKIENGENDYNAKLANKTFFDLSNYKFKYPPKKKKEEKKKGASGGSGGAGDASRGEKQVKIISSKYFVILILMILSLKKNCQRFKIF